MEILDLLFNGPEGLTYGIAPLVLAGVAGAAGGIIKGIGSLFGRRKKRRAMNRAIKAQKEAEAKVMNFKFKNAYEGMEGTTYTPTKAEAQNLAAAAQAGMPTINAVKDAALPGLKDPATMTASTYSAVGYDASQTNADQLARGADTGLTNEMQNLQVSTAASEMAAQEADQSLAASQDLAAQAGTGAGGATALAAAAAKSKAGIAADIDRQTKENEIRRAQGEMQLQREQLGQENLASQFDLGQQQFNVQAKNVASQFKANANNQAMRFNAQAANDAARFNAAASNQFALTQFGTDAAREKFNAGQANQFSRDTFATEARTEQFNKAALNQFSRDQFAADQRIELANVGAANQAAAFGAKTEFEANRLEAAGAMGVQDRQFNRLAAMMGQRQAEAGQAKAADAQQRSMLLGGLSQAASGAASAMSGLGFK